MILIVTSKRDGHVEPVANHLTAAGAPWVRINTEDFATNVDIELSPTGDDGVLHIKDSDITVKLREVSAVWYRKPDPITLRHFSVDQAARDYLEAEFNEIILGLYALLSEAFWINNPFDTRIAHRKLIQLRTAANVGFVVPKTFLTNKAAKALEFSETLEGDLAIKSLGAISVLSGAERDQDHALQYGIFTRRISADELYSARDKIAHMPTLFQEFVSKDYEMRVTCVGKEIFACKIQTRVSDLTADDYRFDTENLVHTATECPELVRPIQAYMKRFGLNFGCFDFIVTPTGQTVFLECNCNGQWYWVEKRTGQPISRAVADQLLRQGHLIR